MKGNVPMHERVEQVSSTDTEVIATNVTPSSESLTREPFRAKFRTGTPRRKSDPVIPETEPSSGEKAPRNRSSSALPPLEIEVTGLRPIKRHAPAFFGDKQGSNHRDAAKGQSYAGGPLDRYAPDRETVESFDTSGSNAGGDIVPHFTDEEFDDWRELSDSGPIRPQPSLLKSGQTRGMLAHGAESRRTNHLTSTHRPARHGTNFNRDAYDGLTEQSDDGLLVEPRAGRRTEGFGRGPRGPESYPSTVGRQGDRTRGRRAPERSPFNRTTSEDSRPRGAREVSLEPSLRHHPRSDSRGKEARFASREADKPLRSSRNSSELIDTTAERLYGKGASRGSTLPSREWSSRVSRPSIESDYQRPLRRGRGER